MNKYYYSQTFQFPVEEMDEPQPTDLMVLDVNLTLPGEQTLRISRIYHDDRITKCEQIVAPFPTAINMFHTVEAAKNAYDRLMAQLKEQSQHE
jgi:hypothetical protein